MTPTRRNYEESMKQTSLAGHGHSAMYTIDIRKGSYDHEGSDYHFLTRLLNALGLHARPSALFVKCASRYDCDVKVAKVTEDGRLEGGTVSGKSIMSLITLGIGSGERIAVGTKNHPDVPDAEMCIRDLMRLVEAKFGED